MASVIIVVDNSKRELFGCLLLSEYLRLRNIKPIICSRFAFYDYFLKYSPSAVVWPNALVDLSEIAANSAVFVMPSESGNGQADQVRNTHVGTSSNPVFPEAVDRFFCWGQGMRDILLDSGRWRRDQLPVSGSPATDHWLMPIPESERVQTGSIGLTTTFRANSDNHFEFLDQIEIHGGDGSYYLPPEHAESWYFLEASLSRVITCLVRDFSTVDKRRVQLRPHPFESEERYKHLIEISNGRLTVVKKGTISEWLKGISILFTFLSASALDAFVRGVPVVSLKGMVDPNAIGKIPKDFHYSYDKMFWQAEDPCQAKEYVDLAMRGKLRPAMNEAGIRQFLAYHFSFPRKIPAALQVAIEIDRVLKVDRGRVVRKYLGSTGVSIPFSLVRRSTPFLPQMMAIYRYIVGFLPWHQNNGFSYQLWRFWERYSSKKASDKIVALFNTKNDKDRRRLGK